MKRKFSRVLGVGLVLVLAIALAMPMAVQAKTLDWGEEDLPVVRGITETFSGKAITPLYDVLGLSAANDGKTIYAVVKAEAGHGSAGQQVVFRSTNGGQSWSKKTPSVGVISHVAVSPDDPTVVVAAGLVGTTPYAWISTDKGETWSASNISGQLSGAITSIAISEERDDIRWVAVGSDAAAMLLTFEVGPTGGTAAWSSADKNSGSYSAYLSDEGVGYTSDTDYGAGRVVIPVNIDIDDITDLSFWFNYTDGPDDAYAAPYMILAIDTGADSIADVWVVLETGGEAGYQPTEGTWLEWDIATHNKFKVHGGASDGTVDTLANIQGLVDGTVLDVKVAVGETWCVGVTAYVDDITIEVTSPTSYDLEAASCLAVAKAEAFAGWNDASAWGGFSDPSATGGVLAVAFSPWFNNDNAMLVVTVSGTETHLQAAEVGGTWAACEFNASTTPFASYPVEIGANIVATAASISLPDTYYGYDAAERIAYIGTTDGVYRMDDVDSEKIKSGILPSVAYDSDENQLLVGYGTSGRVDMSSNPDSGSPTFTRPASMKSPSGEEVSGVAWLGTSMMCSTIGAESAFSVSDDARAWNQLSLIDTDLDNITDVAVSEDGSKIYVASQKDSYYSIWRYASSWERVLCDKKATGQTSVIVRLAPEKPEVVFVGLLGGTSKEIRRSTDSGDTWKQSRSDIVIKDMVAKDDKIVFTVDKGGKVSTSTDGGRTFRDYVKSSVNARHIIVAPNGDVLIAGEDAAKSPTKISVALSTNDGATWSRMPLTTGLEEDTTHPLLVAADTDYATNNLIYIAHTDGDEAYVLRWEVGGDYEVWQDISAPSSYKLDSADVISGLVAHEGMLYVAYYSDNTSGFVSSTNPTTKRTSVTWGGGPLVADTVRSDAKFSLTPQALKVSSGSVKLWAVDTRVDPETEPLNRLYSYTDILGKVEAPTITGPADKYKATVDAALQKINPVQFTWEEVNPDVKYEIKIATNAKMSQHVITYSASGSEYITICDGPAEKDALKVQKLQYPFAAGETYYWRVRVSVPTVGPYSETRSFTIEEAEVPVAPAPVVTVKPPEVTVQPAPAPPAPQVTVEAPPPAPAPAPAIPAYLLWTVIGIGAVLVIALIILIVRTRRVV